ncbi:right-handed parallel beta-helix repeat-containing protein [Photobacterium japonica]|uniref:DUF1565 domain-containing protein n=1 Tax=Photobacterium japonica TaxID=2910235 RepID=UPI003D11158E
MKTQPTLIALALSLWSTGALASTVPISWVPGQTSVENGDVVIYKNACYTAQNNPGKWETPSASSTWFWSATTCDEAPGPTPDPDPDPDPDPEAGDVIPWVAGKTQVKNGDIVGLNNQCFVAKNNPGPWETPKAHSWFWAEVSCPTGPVDPVICPDGSTAPSLEECPNEPVICEDGSTAPSLEECPNEPVVCEDGSTAPSLEECPNEPVICEDGSTAPSLEECPVPPVTCPDGSTAPSLDACASEVSYFVSPDGKDSNNGTQVAPFASLKKALSLAKAGDVIELGEGRYRTAQVIDKANGSADAPIVIQGNNAIFDGTVVIDTPWIVHQGNIYKTTVRSPVWQLFIDDEMVMSARWPNAQLHDGSLWNMKKTWRHQAPESRFGTMIDERPYENIVVSNSGNQYEPLPEGINVQSLADSGIDATGAIAIMNIGSWLNWAQVVESHTPGSDTFTYSKDFSGSGTAMKNAADNMLGKGNFWETKNTKYEEGHYYLEGKLELLDSENEWFFDKQTRTVYLWAPEGKDPNHLTVRGKTQTYGLTVRNASHVLIKDVDFFGTAFTVISSQGITFEDIDAQYYAYSQRMLGDLTRPQTIKFINNSKTLKTTGNTIKDSYLAYTDGPAFEMIKEVGDTVDNNLIHDIDYSNLGTGGEGALNMASQSHDISFTNNTFHTAGNSEGVRVGAASKVIGNHVFNTSLLQHDGAAINVGVEQQAGTEIAYNWVHDTPKAGIRFDGVEGASKVGRDGVVHHNVVWNTQFSIIKGDHQATFNNLMFDNDVTDLVIFNKEDAGGLNFNSETLNNLVGSLQGRKSGTPEQLVVPGTVVSNVTGENSIILSQLKGAHWGDFRPKVNASIIDAGTSDSRLSTIDYLGSAPDIGAYEDSDVAPWIPGHHGDKAMNPVPFNDATKVELTLDLMFKQSPEWGYRVYFGSSPSTLEAVSKMNGAYTVSELQPNTSYFWRVDGVRDGQVTTGDIWHFVTR